MFTVILTGIPKRSIHHLSTSIEDSRRFHDGQLSRSIGIYRLTRPLPARLMRVYVGQGGAREGSASNALSHCRESHFCPAFYRHDAVRAMRLRVTI